MRKILLLVLLLSGCAFGRISADPCTMEGFAIGKSRLHVTCTPAKSMEIPKEEPPKVVMPIVSCPGRYTYLHECIDEEPVPEVVSNSVVKVEEGYIEISGGSPDAGFWSSVFDFLSMAAPLALAYFGI